jgi:hypothetical protein
MVLMMIYYGQAAHLVSIKANNPKQIILYEGAKLGLEEAGEQVHQVIYQWLVEHL